MERIVDIYGNCANFDEMYQPEDSWYGQILVDKNQIFEGVIEDYNQRNMFYVCGKITPEELSVYRLAREGVQLPHHFVGEKDKKDGRFYGIDAVTNLFMDIPVGEVKMSLRPADKTRSETDMERDYIRQRMELVQATLDDESLGILYQFRNDRKQINAAKAEK